MQTESQYIDQTSKVPQPPRLEKPVRITEQVWPEGTLPVVSIWCITYNHANFIRDAIEGFLIQETTFPVEIFIHDDASADGTAQIVKEYAEKYPELLRTVLQKENQWSKGNAKVLFEYLVLQRGQFTALCEGDDRWTDAKKLQIQVDYLESRHSVAGCFHRTRLIDEQGGVIKQDFFVADREEYDFQSCLTSLSKQYATCSMMIRTVTVRKPRPWLERRSVDMLLELQVALHGNLGFIDRNMADYRFHGGGIWSRLDTRAQVLETIFRYQLLLEDRDLSTQYGGLIKQRMSQFEEMLVVRSEYDAVVKEINALRSNRLLSRCRRLLKSYLALRGS
jgi:glycosyltransferase involved in cell wall biosynthesis